MEWTELSILTSNEAVEAITNILHETGASGVLIEDPLDMYKIKDSVFGEVYELNPDDYPEEGVRIKAYLPLNDEAKRTVSKIKEEINKLLDLDINLGKNEITVEEVREEDWATAWKQYFKPAKVSERITIKPTWEEYSSSNDEEIVIELDPGMAFGTGTHPTTVLSIKALEKFMKPNQTVIDVGSGSGILSIAAAKLGASQVFAYDLDEVAVRVSKANIEDNGLSDKITVKQNDLLNSVNIKADLIVSNILAEIIVKFVEDAWNNLCEGGLFITSGIIQSKKEHVLDELKTNGFEIIEINELEDWVSITAQKNQ